MAKRDAYEGVAAPNGGDQVTKGLIVMFVGVMATAAIAAGCGSSSEDSTASLTKAQFIAQADAICKASNAEIESEFEAFAKKNNIGENEEPSKAQEAELSETILVPNVTNQGEEIRDLAAPSGDEDEVSAMLDSLDEGVEEVEANPQAPFESKQPNPFGPANKLATEYGLEVCGQG
jgi:hypothetical protein